MKTHLKISLCLNLGLAAGLFFLLLNGSKRVTAPALQVVAETRPPLNTTAATPPPTASRTEPKPFRWNQLESKDYRTYVRNLRAIGCPERTVRDLVSADAEFVFGPRREALEHQLSDLANASWSARLAAAKTEAALKDELQNLPAQETALINRMLGLQPTPSATETEANLAANDGAAEDPAPVRPLIWNVDPTNLNLSDNQMEVINDLRQSFVNKIGGPNQDPNDPAYSERWQQAQPEADDMLRTMLGVTVFQSFQMAANANSQAPAATKP
jgi:hypothetical protein